jgi:hypothetical protein
MQGAGEGVSTARSTQWPWASCRQATTRLATLSITESSTWLAVVV